MRHWNIFALIVTAAALLGACAAPAPTDAPATLVPSLAPSPLPTLQPSVTPGDAPLVGTPTETPIMLEIQPLAGQGLPPPFTITLPTGWEYGYDTLILNDVDSLRGVPLAFFTGPINGGVGFIVVLWGFPNLTAGDVLTGGQPSLYADGLRFLRLAVVEPQCNIGTDLERSYRIGLRAATGTPFAAVDCPDLPDTKGWFAGLNEGGLNFLFFMYADPIQAMDTGNVDLQGILDSVRFDVQTLIATLGATPSVTAAPLPIQIAQPSATSTP